MPKSSSKEKEEAPKGRISQLSAAFAGVRKERPISVGQAHKILRDQVRLHGSEIAAYKELVMYVQTTNKAENGNTTIVERNRDMPIPARITWVTEEHVVKERTKKRMDEAQARKMPGHTSFKPPPLLQTNTYVLMVGKISFLVRLARLHMEEIKEVSNLLLDLIEVMTNLSSYGSNTKEPSCVIITPDSKDHLTYNLRYTAHVLRRADKVLSTEELLERV